MGLKPKQIMIWKDLLEIASDKYSRCNLKLEKKNGFEAF